MSHSDSNAAQPAGAEASPSFCIVPWKHLNILPDGTVKACCHSQGAIGAETDEAMSVHMHGLEAIWNSPHMVKLRQSMADGQRVPDCKVCYSEEASGGKSRRLRENELWSGGYLNSEGVSLDELIARSRERGFAEPPPIDFQLDVGNVCNLKCRMCTGDWSSRIASDPVHSRWSLKAAVDNNWKNDAAIIGPERVHGVRYQGFYGPRFGYTVEQEQGPDAEHGSAYGWTNGAGIVRFPVLGYRLGRIEVRIAADRPADHPVTITLDGHVLYDGRPEPGAFTALLDVGALELGEYAELRILGPVTRTVRFMDMDCQAGVNVEEIKIHRAPREGVKERRRPIFSRFDGDGQWFQQQSFVYGDLLGRPEGLRKLVFIGGEPMYIPEVRKMMQYLTDNGAAAGIELSFATNATVVDDEFLAMAACFERVLYCVSMDGVGPTYEYIRFPGKWDVVTANVRLLKAADNASVTVIPSFQIYNALDIVEVFRYCDREGLEILFNAVYTPEYLSALSLPRNARDLAARRLRDYAENECREYYRDQVLSLAKRLETVQGDYDEAALRQFMLFTNDLDASRGQVFREALPELHELIQASDFVWSNEMRYARAG